MTIKEDLYKQCILAIEGRLQTVKETIADIQKALLSETKSSAGDKHETGRAMLQLEREKAGKQLAEIQKLQQVLSKINVSQQSQHVSLGSIVYTTNANYFIAISAGELSVNDEVFYAISATTPIGRLIIGKMVGDEVVFNTNTFQIKEIK